MEKTDFTDKFFVCDICLAVEFKSLQEYESHRQIHFQGYFPCPVCKKIFTEISGLENHQSVHAHYEYQSHNLRVPNASEQSPLTTLDCPICKSKQTSKKELQHHFKSLHDDLLAYQCHLCPHISYGRQEYLLHRYKSHQPKCPICNFETTSDEELQLHYHTHRQTVTVLLYICETCTVSFESKESLLTHKQLCHGHGHEFLPTTSGTQSLSSNSTVQPEEPSKKIIVVHFCRHCNTTFTSQTELDLHVNTVHSLKCTFCAHISKTKSLLHIHILKYHTFTSCRYCKTKFKTSIECKNHEKSKTCRNSMGNDVLYKPYNCEICNKKFMLEGSLKIHNCDSDFSQSNIKNNLFMKYLPEDENEVTFVLTT